VTEQMAALDHRRATAERNAAAILDATERLIAQRTPLSIAAVAAEAGVSRPTLYAHYETLADVIEKVVQRAVDGSLSAVDAAEPEVGPADDALGRMLKASWKQLARQDALARAAAEFLPAQHMHRSHAPLMARMARLVERGQADGVFRTDVPSSWLVTAYFSLVHAADEFARAQRMKRDDALALLERSVRDLFAGRREDRKRARRRTSR
jgi:TetR/AcrR family transcriptional regulator, mexCD-oprJ operon repressor